MTKGQLRLDMFIVLISHVSIDLFIHSFIKKET